MYTANQIQEAATIIIKNCTKLQSLESILFLIDFKVIPPTINEGIEEGAHCTFSVTEDGCPHWTIAVVITENDTIDILMTKLMHELCHVKQSFCLIEILMEEKGLSQEEACFEAEACWRKLHHMFDYWDRPIEKYAYSFQEFGTAYYLDMKDIMKKMVTKRLGI